MYKLMTSGGVAHAIAGEQAPRDLVLLSAILAAAVHDYGHLGVTNDFLVKVMFQVQCHFLFERQLSLLIIPSGQQPIGPHSQ